MVFDDIIIGSGLTALATAIGLAPDRRILVLGGPRHGRIEYYDESRSVPRSFLGFGGLGNYWHGIIPTGSQVPFAREANGEITALFKHFYPRADIASRLGEPWLFVPRRPIRTSAEWKHLRTERGSNLEIVFEDALSFELGDDGAAVRTENAVHRSRRLWVAAGALETPKLLETSLGHGLRRASVSDHIICYSGQIDRTVHRHISAPPLEHAPGGFWLRTYLTDAADALFMTKPARFDYKTLDTGFEQRAAFGLRTSSAISKIARAGSLGLVSEALFNRFGLFPDSPILSVYAQIVVRDAYEFSRSDGALRLSMLNAMRAVEGVAAPWPEMTRTRKPDLFLKGIHLHHTVDIDALAALGATSGRSVARIVDSSVLDEIGPEHHSFYTMANACRLAQEAGA